MWNSCCSLLDAQHEVHQIFELPRRQLRCAAVRIEYLAVEYQAESFYWDACSSTVDPEMRELYRQLAEFENGHMTWIERRLEGIGGSE